MSWPAVAWALSRHAPSSTAKFLLVALADSASAGDWLAWPSVAYLGSTTQQDRKTVLANLKRLQEFGLIEPAGKTGKTAQVMVWRLPVDHPAPSNSPKSGTPSGGGTVPKFPPKSPNLPAKESQKRDTEPVLNLSGTKSGARSMPKASPETPIPDGFSISDAVRQWASARGYDQLDEHLEAFKLKAEARGYRYADWDKAFMVAIRADWARVRTGTVRRPVLDCDEVIR